MYKLVIILSAFALPTILSAENSDTRDPNDHYESTTSDEFPEESSDSDCQDGYKRRAGKGQCDFSPTNTATFTADLDNPEGVCRKNKEKDKHGNEVITYSMVCSFPCKQKDDKGDLSNITCKYEAGKGTLQTYSCGKADNFYLIKDECPLTQKTLRPNRSNGTKTFSLTSDASCQSAADRKEFCKRYLGSTDWEKRGEINPIRFCINYACAVQTCGADIVCCVR